MLSMSKEFYNYISNKLITFFKNETLSFGDKYYLELDEESQVKQLYDSLCDTVNCNNDPEVTLEPFTYSHDGGNEYNTQSILINDSIKIVVANSTNVTMDYLVTLRNAVTEQENEWKNTILFIICNNLIDSIENGMSNLQREGMPLNFKSISDNLEKEVDDKRNGISKVDKQIIKFQIEQKNKDNYENTLWDYEDILSLINKGNVDEEDLRRLSLFPDRELSDDLNSRTIRNMIQENYDEYNRVLDDHQYDNCKERLSKHFNETGVTKLNQTNWFAVDFSNIRKYKADKSDSIEYIPNRDKHTLDDKLVYWEKPEAEKGAKLRKRNIIIFNTSNVDKIKLTFNFDKALKQKYILKNSLKYATTSGKKLNVQIPVKSDETTFAKIQYKHNDLTKLKYEFRIAIVDCEEDILNPIKTMYSVNVPKKWIEIINNDTTTQVSFGNGINQIEKEITSSDENIDISLKDTIKISENSPAWIDSDELQFNLVYDSFKIPISITEKNKKTVPVESIRLWDQKRVNEDSFNFNGKRAVQGVESFSVYNDFKRFLEYEKQIVTNKIFHGSIDQNNHIHEEKLNLSDRITETYNRILDFYENMEESSDECGYPSLVYIDSELEELYRDFLETYNEEIEDIADESILSDLPNKYDLSKIGRYTTDHEIYFSSLSPINMAYQLKIKDELNNEQLDNNILKRINDENLVPYIYDENEELFKPTVDLTAKEWIKYEKDKDVSIGTTNQFISKVIEEKIIQFTTNFSYLFITKKQAPICLNIINIKQDKEIVKGIFNFINNRFIKNNNRKIIPVEINIYNNADKSYFDKFFECETAEDFEKEFGIDIKSNDYDTSDILHVIQNNITYYKNHEKPETYAYAHISFYKVGDESQNANGKMSEIETGLLLNGILSDATAYNSKSGYRVGFGTKNLIDENDLLIRTTINTNEIMENSKHNGEYTYHKRNTIIAKPMAPGEEDLEKIYETSNWVTFIEPSFGLEYFDTKKDLIIIHYSDQYTSSSKYDTITVTSKNKEYRKIIKDFLKDKNITVDEENIKNVIRLFNGINGEWLLRIISNYSYYNREKISIISALKYSFTILKHPEIIWIPISMDEILRIAGTVGLSKNDSIFNKSDLSGPMSDDLLMVGIHEDNNSNIKVYYYPIEVKEGINEKDVEIKAEKQLENTYNLIIKYCFNEEEHVFRNKFYRNFFMQIALSNFEKLSKLEIWNQNEKEKMDKLKAKLNNDLYTPSIDLEQIIQKGTVFSFKKGSTTLTINNDEDFQIIEMPDEYAYIGVAKTFEEVNDEINKNKFTIDDKLLLKNYKLEELDEIEVNDITATNLIDTLENNEKETVKSFEVKNDNKTSINIENTNNTQENQNIHEEVQEKDDTSNITQTTENKNIHIETSELKPINEVRALIGTLTSNKRKIYWEYGNSKLSNRHLLILGKSGYGKTYFLQCLIAEMSKQDIPTLIIDYSDAFTTKEIQPELKEYLGEDNLQNYYVKLNKFPLNPFKKYRHEFDGNYYDESNEDVASRIKSIFDSVYNLGIIQQDTLRTAIINGLKKSESMSFDDLKNELIALDTKNAMSVLGQINEFLSFKPFNSDDSFGWSELDERNGKVIIIQLNGYSKDVQKIITEFILWDLWNYKQVNGDVNKPFNVILDEAQNLDFSDNSPCIKILKEGRKFGWSAWLSTQTINSLIKKIGSNPFNIADEKIYFHPVDNTRKIASGFTTDNNEKNYWTEKLNELKKAECVVIGSTKDGTDDLSPSKPYYVSVDSLKSRLS